MQRRSYRYTLLARLSPPAREAERILTFPRMANTLRCVALEHALA